MTTPIDESLAWMRDVMRQSSEQVFNFGTKIATWLTLGNAAALTIVFNSIVKDGLDSAALFYRSIVAFTVGLFAAFLGSVVSYFGSVVGLNLVAKSATAMNEFVVSEYYIAELEKDGISVPDDAPLSLSSSRAGEALEKLNAKQWQIWRWVWLSVILYLISASCFAAGILIPATKLSSWTKIESNAVADSALHRPSPPSPLPH